MSAQLLAEAKDALAEAVREERSMRIGHDVARVLFVALTEAEVERQQQEPESQEHRHAWRTLGWDRPGDGAARVVQVCDCGDARELKL